ncbi:hypothetical protein AHAS_Ahas20G0020000 [Arachis hypogaea]
MLNQSKRQFRLSYIASIADLSYCADESTKHGEACGGFETAAAQREQPAADGRGRYAVPEVVLLTNRIQGVVDGTVEGIPGGKLAPDAGCMEENCVASGSDMGWRAAKGLEEVEGGSADYALQEPRAP